MDTKTLKLQQEKQELLETLSVVVAWCNLGIDTYIPVWAKAQWLTDCERLHKVYNKYKNEQ